MSKKNNLHIGGMFCKKHRLWLYSIISCNQCKHGVCCNKDKVKESLDMKVGWKKDSC